MQYCDVTACSHARTNWTQLTYRQQSQHNFCSGHAGTSVCMHFPSPHACLGTHEEHHSGRHVNTASNLLPASHGPSHRSIHFTQFTPHTYMWGTMIKLMIRICDAMSPPNLQREPASIPEESIHVVSPTRCRHSTHLATGTCAPPQTIQRSVL